MSDNKHALTRYRTLDKCFRNPGRNYFIDDLLDEVNAVLCDMTPESNGIKIRQLRDDIRHMKSEAGYAAPIETFIENRKAYYRYSDLNFSINSQPLNQQEAQQLKETLITLSRFKGLPQFEWVQEMQIRLEDTFKLNGETITAVGFEQNPYLKGLSYFTDLFNAIQNNTCLSIKYKGFKQLDSIQIEVHPWYLKQFNNRWFLFGLNEKYQSISNLAIDRIISITESKTKYLPNQEINFDEFFEDVVGVTVKANAELEKVVIKATLDIWPYIESKPLHGSQKTKLKTDTEVIIELNLQINYELMALLFSYMDAIEIMEPISLREKFKTVSKNIFLKYK